MSAVPKGKCSLSSNEIKSGCQCIDNKKSCPRGVGDEAIKKIREIGSEPESATYNKEGKRTNEDLNEDDQVDCANYLGAQGLLDWMCVGGKSATKGYADCGGTGIPCGTLIIGGLAAVLLIMVIK